MVRVWVARDALSTIEREATRNRLVETCGCLVGYESDDRQEAVITKAFGPGPNAKHRPRSYRPGQAHTQAVLDRVHAESTGGTRTWASGTLIRSAVRSRASETSRLSVR